MNQSTQIQNVLNLLNNRLSDLSMHANFNNTNCDINKSTKNKLIHTNTHFILSRVIALRHVATEWGRNIFGGEIEEKMSEGDV